MSSTLHSYFESSVSSLVAAMSFVCGSTPTAANHWLVVGGRRRHRHQGLCWFLIIGLLALSIRDVVVITNLLSAAILPAVLLPSAAAQMMPASEHQRAVGGGASVSNVNGGLGGPIELEGGGRNQQPQTDLSRSTSRCNEAQFHSCVHKFDLILQDQTLGFAVTEKELNAACSYLNEGIRCLDDFINTCVREERQRQKLRDSVKGAFEILKMLCEPNSFHRAEYLEHSMCYRRLASGFKGCTNELQQLTNDPLTTHESLCCAYRRAANCSYKLAEKECGKRAAFFLKNYTERSAQPVTFQCSIESYRTCRDVLADPSASSSALGGGTGTAAAAASDQTALSMSPSSGDSAAQNGGEAGVVGSDGQLVVADESSSRPIHQHRFFTSTFLAMLMTAIFYFAIRY